MRILPTILLLPACALLLSACAGNATLPAAYSFEGREEKAALAVLRNVEADDAQRARILEAYDRYNPVMLKLDTEWDALMLQWEQMDRSAAAFSAEANALAARRMEVARQQILTGAAFEREVASTLTPEQWKDWQELWSLTGEGQGACGPVGGLHGRRRR